MASHIAWTLIYNNRRVLLYIYIYIYNKRALFYALSQSHHRLEHRVELHIIACRIFYSVYYYLFEFHRCLRLISSWERTPPAAQERRTRFYCLIGVFRLCAGNDWLDVLSVGRLDALFRRIFRRGPRLHPVDDHGRTVLARPQTCGHVHRGPRQLDS